MAITGRLYQARSIALSDSQAFASDSFYDPEQVFGGMYRWAKPHALIRLPNDGSHQILSLSLAGMRPGGTEVLLSASGYSIPLRVAAAPRRYHVLIPSFSWGARSTVVLLQSPELSPAGESRSLGVMVGDLAQASLGHGPWAALALLPLGLLLLYLLLCWAGAPAPWADAAALAAMLLLAAALVAWREQFAPLLLLVGLVIPAVLAWLYASWTRARPPVGVVAMLLLGAATRLPLVAMPELVGDHTTFQAWGEFHYQHGLSSFYSGIIDYPPLWMYAGWGLTWLLHAAQSPLSIPLPVLNSLVFKLPAILADLVIALLVYHRARRRAAGWRALAIGAAWLALPPVWLNSAWWGQVDVLPALALVGALLLWDRAGGAWSWALFAAGLLIKAQMVVFAPLLLVATLRQRGLRGMLRGGLSTGAAALAVCAPLLLTGQGCDLWRIYFSSVNRYPQVGLGSDNLWRLLTWGQGINEAPRHIDGWLDTRPLLGPISYHAAGLALLGALALWCCWLLWRRCDAAMRLRVAILLALGFFVLPTQVHERYMFPVYLLLAIWLAESEDARWPMLLLALSGTLNLFRYAPFIPRCSTRSPRWASPWRRRRSMWRCWAGWPSRVCSWPPWRSAFAHAAR